MKFAVIEGELQQALEYLDQALMTAEEKNLGLLFEQLVREKRQLQEEYGKWQELIRRNASVQERLEQARLSDFIVEARKMVGMLE